MDRVLNIWIKYLTKIYRIIRAILIFSKHRGMNLVRKEIKYFNCKSCIP